MLDREVSWLERSGPLGRWGDTIRPAIATAVGTGHRRDALTGRWLGHPAHPVAVLAPMACWMGSIVLDLTGAEQSRKSAQRLLQFGIVAAAPAEASGAADWLDTTNAEQRVGTAHALANNLATVAFGISLLFRRRGHHRAGVVTSLVGAGFLGAAGFLGGHLAYRRGVGVDTTAFECGPTEWTELEMFGPLAADSPIAAKADGVALMAVQTNHELHVLEDRCTHRGGPLHDGGVDDGCITCPWHQSRFDLRTGKVVNGPATAPQPVYEVRGHDRIEVRREELGGLRQNPVTITTIASAAP